MRAGQCRHHIEIEQSVDVPDGSTGQLAETWIPYRSTWASITPVRGNERFAWAQERADITHLIECRHIDGVTAKMRITHGTRLFDITSVADFRGRGRWLQIMVREQV